MNLRHNSNHLPYNPELIPRAKKLRKNMTAAEKKLWYEYLKAFPHRVYRQRPINHYIVDFYCPKLKLVIEVDGDSHFTPEAQESDRIRTEILEGYSLTVLRFTNEQIRKNFEGVCQTLKRYSINPF